MSTEVAWEPATLSFQIALNKVAVQQLHASNNSATTAFTFKVKTTNPKRYSVRPNVGVMWPGETAQVTVQLPVQRELPPDMAKCKDKFQVLTLPLGGEHANELLALPSDERRVALTELWASDAVKDATVDKIRCTFSHDATRSDPIPEEGPVTPYSPEPAAPLAATPAPGGTRRAADEPLTVEGTPVPATTPSNATPTGNVEMPIVPAGASDELQRLLVREREAYAE